MDKFDLLVNLYSKSQKEIKTVKGHTNNYVSIINILSFFIDNDLMTDAVKSILTRKAPLLYVYSCFNTNHLKGKYLAEAKNMIIKSRAVIEGKTDMSVCFADINKKYGYYFDLFPFQSSIQQSKEKMCFVCIYEEKSEKTILDYKFTYEDFLNDKSFEEELALILYMLSDEFEKIKDKS